MEYFLSIWNQQNSEKLESDLSTESWETYFNTYKILNQQFKHGLFDTSEFDRSSPGGKGSSILTKESKLIEEYKKLFKNFNFSETLETHEHVPKLKPNFPRLSMMNREQHAIYLDISKRLLMNNSFSLKTKKKVLKLFELLDTKVQKERAMFSKFVEEEWNIKQKKLKTLNCNVAKFVNTIWKLRLGCVKLYPRMYDRQKTIPLTYQGNKDLIKMLPMTEPLMSVGKEVECLPINFKEPVFINTRNRKLSNMFPPYKNINESGHIYGPTVSCDKRAEDLSVKNNVDIVISPSVLSLIACHANAKFDKEWDIPVIVKEYQLEGKTGVFKKRIVYVDKALPPRSMSVFDKRHFFCKIGTKFKLCKRIYSQTARHPTETSSKNIVDPTTDTTHAGIFEVNNGISNSIANNYYCTCPSPNVCSKINDPSELDEIESDDSDNLVIDCSEDEVPTFEMKPDSVKENTLLRSHNNSSSISLRSDTGHFNSENITSVQHTSSETKIHQHSTEVKVNSNNFEPGGSLMSSLNCLTCGKQLYKQDPLKKSIDTLTPGLSSNNKNITSQSLSCSSVGTNFHDGKILQSEVLPDKKYVYHKWKISADRSRVEGSGLNILKSECGIRPLNLLIRSKVDGYKVVNNKQIPVQIFPKLEYQYQYGMESLTTSELYKQWTTLYLKPKSVLNRVRINAFTSQFILIEEKSLEDLESLNRNMRPAVLGTIYSLLLGLMDLGPGSYLLSHRNTMGPFVSLLSESKKEESFDLHKEYEVGGAEYVSNLAWRPIDVNMQTPYQKIKNLVPGMFLPADHIRSPRTHGKNRKTSHNSE